MKKIKYNLARMRRRRRKRRRRRRKKRRVRGRRLRWRMRAADSGPGAMTDPISSERPRSSSSRQTEFTDAERIERMRRGKH